MAVDIGIFEKLRELKNRYLNEHPDALRQIEEWENRVQKLSRDQDYFNQEATQELYKLLKNRIKTHMTARLQKGRTPEDNRISDAQETGYSRCLTRITRMSLQHSRNLLTVKYNNTKRMLYN